MVIPDDEQYFLIREDDEYSNYQSFNDYPLFLHLYVRIIINVLFNFTNLKKTHAIAQMNFMIFVFFSALFIFAFFIF